MCRMQMYAMCTMYVIHALQHSCNVNKGTAASAMTQGVIRSFFSMIFYVDSLKVNASKSFDKNKFIIN